MIETTSTDAMTNNAAEIGHEAKAQAATVVHEAGDQLRSAFGDVRRDLRAQASEQTGRAGSGLRQLDTQLQALRRGDIEAAGPVIGYAEQLQLKVQQLADRIEGEGFDGVVADVRRFARGRPGLFLASAAAAGFVAGRLARGAVGAQQPTPASGPSPSLQPSGTFPLPPTMVGGAGDVPSGMVTALPADPPAGGAVRTPSALAEATSPGIR